jgi:hypothetical protein
MVVDKIKLCCAECNIKLNIINSIKCECQKILCFKHRYFDKHICSIDYKDKDRKILEKNNQKIVADKIIYI